ncbi:response regulator [Aureimonas sp. SA4125]|uniref:response regulator n=1 Tax=Aureimonas sp. SA4125 TaxID=2826993 RepID=UPI001CC4A0AC|nr:response regulator [Aureimonas sp. SA4125]BDA83269.1 response regulator [Aureimonas sp. SA4125]
MKPDRYAVLVVEDDPLLLTDAMDLVEEAGLLAYGARHADAAILMLERHPNIRVLFTDVQMPGSMDGLKLARAVRDRWPPVVIMVTSGMVKVAKDDMPENGLFFAKPYPPADIIAALNRISSQIQS